MFINAKVSRIFLTHRPKFSIQAPFVLHPPSSSQSQHFQYCVIIVFQFRLDCLQWASPPIFICACCKMQFSQMTLKYCIVISEICFCSVATSKAPRTAFVNWTGCDVSDEEKKKRRRKNSFNAFNLHSFFVYIPFIIFPFCLSLSNINIGFTSWLCSRNALDILLLLLRFKAGPWI